jgi:predicted signal transduction protein with EAL and GGDEF domain
MQSSRPRIAAALILTVLTTFLLSVVWESGLEQLVCDALGFAYDTDYERAEYIRFVLTSTGFAIVSLVVPAIMLLRMFGRLQDTHNSTIAAQELAQSLARHDPLTGLPNRRLFFENLQQAMRDSRARKGDCAVFLIDLDHFKFVNDLFGHEAGDRVLCNAADRIAAIVPAGGTVDLAAGPPPDRFRGPGPLASPGRHGVARRVHPRCRGIGPGIGPELRASAARLPRRRRMGSDSSGRQR